MNQVGVSSATEAKILGKHFAACCGDVQRDLEIYERRHDGMRIAAFEKMNMCMCMCRMLGSQAVNVVGCLAHESCA
jgi:hypothetical protein